MVERQEGATANVVARYELKYPIEHGKETITEFVAIRRLQAKDFRGIKSTEIMFDDMLTLIGRLFNVPTSVVDKLDAADMMGASEIVNTFFGSGPKAGEKD